MILVEVYAGFSPKERARAAEIRAFADQPENLFLPDKSENVPGADARYANVFAGVRTVYSITQLEGRKYRHITFSVPGEKLPPARACVEIATQLFGLDVKGDSSVGVAVDPTDPWVRGFAQEIP